MWSLGATVAAVCIQASAGTEFRCPFLGLPASVKFGIQATSGQYWPDWELGSPHLLEHLPSMDEGGLFRITMQTAF